MQKATNSNLTVAIQTNYGIYYVIFVIARNVPAHKKLLNKI